MIKQTANIVTGSRILGSILLLLFPAFSVSFYVLYLFCGITDMIDGTIARKTNSVSKWGARADTVADMVFVVVCMAKILPLIQIPSWLWVWIVIIATVKMGNIVWGLIRNKKLISIHSFLNKGTGFLLFLLPLSSFFAEVKYTSVVVCSVATLAALQEGFYIVKNCENK